MAEPYCLAMVLCDSVYQDPATGKFTLLGTFSTIRATEFPTKTRFCVYCAVTDGLGKSEIKLKIVHAKKGKEADDEMILETPAIEINFSNPIAVVEGVMKIETDLPNEGVYICELFAGNDLLMSRRLVATSLKEKSKPQGEGE